MSLFKNINNLITAAPIKKHVSQVKNKKVIENNKPQPVHQRGLYKGYDAAKQSNASVFWNKSPGVADADIYQSLTLLRARSRELANNDPIMKHYLHMMAQNVVGDGFKLQTLAKTLQNTFDSKLNTLVNQNWNDFSKKDNCDLNKKVDLTVMCHILIKTLAKDGEFILKINRGKATKNNKYGFNVQMLDVERLDVELNQDLAENVIRMGVEFNRLGQPVAYHIRKYDKNDNNYLSGTYKTNLYERITVDNLLHVFLAESPEQTRGVPWSHAAMVYMSDLSEFNQACLIAGKLGASSSIYLERSAGTSVNEIADEQDDDGNYYAQMGFGEIRALPRGHSFKSFEGKYPTDAYQIFTKRLLQQISGALGLSQLVLGNDTEDINFSTSRTVMAEDRNYFKQVQKFMINNLMNFIFEKWLEQSFLNNVFSLNLQQYEEVKRTYNFIGRNWEYVDPAKEEEAIDKAYKNLRQPISATLSEEGKDFSEVLQQYKQDRELVKEILGEDFKLPDITPENLK